MGVHSQLTAQQWGNWTSHLAFGEITAGVIQQWPGLNETLCTSHYEDMDS